MTLTPSNPTLTITGVNSGVSTPIPKKTGIDSGIEEPNPELIPESK